MRVLVTGAGRGIGLELARQYAARGDRVLAGVRDIARAPALSELIDRHEGRVVALPLEVTGEGSVAAAVRRAREAVDGLDVLINNAAIGSNDATVDGPDGQEILDAGRLMEILRVNAVAPLLVAQSFLGLLRAGDNPRIVNISSGAGSLAYRTGGGDYGYPTSKAALNMLTRVLAGNLRGEGVTAVAIDPGWVKTDMGGPDAHLTPEESVRGLLAVIDGLGPADTGRYLRYDGGEVPW